jgi:hypothetical protein
MSLEFHKPSYSQGGYWEVLEDGKKVGERRQYMDGSRITRTDHCQVHAWSDSIHWAASEQFPGDKKFTHWEEKHPEAKA